MGILQSKVRYYMSVFKVFDVQIFILVLKKILKPGFRYYTQKPLEFEWAGRDF